MEENLANLEVATENRSAYHRPPVPMATPWLVFTHKEGIPEQPFCNSCERTYTKTHRRSIPEMSSSFRYFLSPSHQGWLVVYTPPHDYPESWRSKDGDCFLWNPVSLKKILLPSLHSITHPEGCIYVESGLLSAPPTINPIVDNDSVVFFLLSIHDHDTYSLEYTIVFCRPGDKHWRSQILPSEVIPRSIAWFRGKLHVLCEENMQLVIEKQLGPDDEMSLFITIMEFPVALDINKEINLLESRDELFVVVVDYHVDVGRYEEIISFQVFRMNFSLKVWEKVKSLGDHVLFLGGRTVASCSAADLGLTQGRVYFTLPEDKIVYVFDPEGGTISFDRTFSEPTKRCFQAEWVEMPMSIRVNANEAVNVEADQNINSSVDSDKKEWNKSKEGTKILKSGTWGSLDMDMIELIASYLHPVDYIHFRAVCKTHRLVTPMCKRTALERSHTTSLSPWLILHQNNKDCVYRFINPMHNNEAYLLNLSESLLDATIHCSKGGWLLMSKSCKRNLFFFNPFTRNVIRLPEFPLFWCNFQGISFSSIPTSSDCTVLAISGRHSDYVYTSSISRGDDFWDDDYYKNTNSSTSEGEYLRFNLCRSNPVFIDGCFYCLDTHGILGIYDLQGKHSWNVLDKLVPACTSYHQSFLVECEGQLLSVFVKPLKTKPVQIFKLLPSEETEGWVWVEVTDLGKYMLFVSHTSCIAAVAPVSRMKNKIYFPRLHNERIVFFSLDTCRYQTLLLTGSQYSSSNFYSTRKHLYCTWIEPNWSATTDTELVWS